MKNHKVLFIEQNADLVRILPYLFSRAGFQVDVMTSALFITKNKYITTLERYSCIENLMDSLRQKNIGSYDIIVPLSDKLLKIIRDSDLSLEQKLQILPVKTTKDFCHLYSKIELSRILAENKIVTPKFCVANNLKELVRSLEMIGFPALIKMDSSAGGEGIFEYNNLSDLQNIAPQNFTFPVLIQEKIAGDEYDLSAFYRDEKLISFNYSKILRRMKKFSVSNVRLYIQRASIGEEIFGQMQLLGKALGANGFINISAIKSEIDGKFYFFEADMRPNLWADSGKYVGEDLAPRIAGYFNSGEVAQFSEKINSDFPLERVIPCIWRIKFSDILCNRYNAWQSFSLGHLPLFYSHVVMKIRNFLWLINRIPTLTIRFFLPEKQVRKNFKMKMRNLIPL